MKFRCQKCEQMVCLSYCSHCGEATPDEEMSVSELANLKKQYEDLKKQSQLNVNSDCWDWTTPAAMVPIIVTFIGIVVISGGSTRTAEPWNPWFFLLPAYTFMGLALPYLYHMFDVNKYKIWKMANLWPILTVFWPLILIKDIFGFGRQSWK